MGQIRHDLVIVRLRKQCQELILHGGPRWSIHMRFPNFRSKSTATLSRLRPSQPADDEQSILSSAILARSVRRRTKSRLTGKIGGRFIAAPSRCDGLIPYRNDITGYYIIDM